jgi:predicted NAD/FAD-dependent oxidoreductase
MSSLLKTCNSALLMEELQRDRATVLDCVSRIPSMVTMILLKSPLPRPLFPFDSVTFLGTDGGRIGTLGWIARDTSKPGRFTGDAGSGDGMETWVLHATAQISQEVIAEVGSGLGPAETKKRVNEVAAKALKQAFVEFVEMAMRQGGGPAYDSGALEASIVRVEGHRWGGAFPVLDVHAANFAERSALLVSTGGGHSYIHKRLQYAAIGDFFSPSLAGRVEGAAVSALSAVDSILLADSSA